MFHWIHYDPVLSLSTVPSMFCLRIVDGKFTALRLNCRMWMEHRRYPMESLWEIRLVGGLGGVLFMRLHVNPHRT